MCASNKPVHKNSSVSLIIHRRFAFVVATTTVVVALSSSLRRSFCALFLFGMFIYCLFVGERWTGSIVQFATSRILPWEERGSVVLVSIVPGQRVQR